jgi:hypothetical protein
VGGLFIAATVAGVLAASLALGNDIFLTEASTQETRVATEALLELVMGAAIAGIVIVIYPFLRRYGERLALGYVVARTIECVFYGLSVVGALTVLTLSRDFVDAGAPDTGYLRSLGDALLAARDHGNYTVLSITFSLSAVILNYALFRPRLVPPWLSV